MEISVYPDAANANDEAAHALRGWLQQTNTRNIMVAGGNSPLELYGRIAALALDLSHLRVFALDEYVGVPLEEPRNTANLLRTAVAEAWKIPSGSFFPLSSLPEAALTSVQEHERIIERYGGLDVLVLGLGQNGHVAFNEPGSTVTDCGRLVSLEPSSVAANACWFDNAHAPDTGVTVGLPTLLASRRVLLLAFGASKAGAVRAMVEGPRDPSCPASWFQGHPETRVFLDGAAAGALSSAAR